MAKQLAKQPKRKHVPRRTCIACREVESKRGLVRIVRTPDGIIVDPSGKQAGRGAYLHADPSCWSRALEANLVARALRTKVDAQSKQRLEAFADAIVADESSGA